MTKKIMKFVVTIIMTFSLFGIHNNMAYAAESAFPIVDYSKTEDIRVVTDNGQIEFDVKPQIIEDRTLVPMRAIFEELGLEVTWDGETQTAKGTAKNKSISFKINSDKAKVNGKEKTLDVPAQIIGDRTMIPLRFLSENMGYNVLWVQESNIILISKNEITEEWKYGGADIKWPHNEYEIKYINGEATPFIRYTGTNVESPIKIYLSPSNQPANEYAVGDTTEKIEMEALALKIKEILDNEYVCEVIMGSVLGNSFQGRPLEADELGADVYLAIHSNASGTTIASGAVGFYHPLEPQGKLLVTNIVEELNKIAPEESNRYEQVKSGMDEFGGYGLGEIREPYKYNLIATLIETDFHDNPITANWIINNKDEIARAYVNGIVKTFNIKEKSNI